MTRILFVCLGNICRSPTAHGVFEHLVHQRGLDAEIQVDSAGTGRWHTGEAPDGRATAAAARRGYALESQRARQICSTDFQRFDYILAMDRQNLAELQQHCPADFSGRIELFLDYHPEQPIREVPDPYYGGDDGFQQVLDLVEHASIGLLAALKR